MNSLNLNEVFYHQDKLYMFILPSELQKKQQQNYLSDHKTLQILGSGLGISNFSLVVLVAR